MAGATGPGAAPLDRQAPQDGLELLFEALVINPHALALHQAIWETLSILVLPQPLVRDTSSSPDLRCSTSIRTSAFAAAIAAPSCCGTARSCHEWDSFVEERIAPAKNDDALA